MVNTMTQQTIIKIILVWTAMLLPSCLWSQRVPSADELPQVTQLPVRHNMPDPLVMLNGTAVNSRQQWFEQRRPELKRLFQHYMYGTLPAASKIHPQLERENRRTFGGKATLKQITLSFDLSDVAPIHLLLVLPNMPGRPVPIFLGINFCGNFAVVGDHEVPLPKGWMKSDCAGCQNFRATEAGRGADVEKWAIESSIDRGYAFATFYNGDIAPDDPSFKSEIYQQTGKQSDDPRGEHEGGAIIAWAWGVQRVVDYLVTDQALDPNRIAVVGHSRLGKAVLLAAAFDERIALVIPHQAGCGGTAPSRGRTGETVKQINTKFPHWFCPAFAQFNDQVDRLPFDQDSLVALVAPRPVLLTNALEDTWANPEGQFEVLKSASRVYQFLQAGQLDAEHMPEPGKLVDSRLGYYIRPGKHSMRAEDWKVFLDFAEKNLATGSMPKR
jgi:hypothetical protein